MTSRPPFLGRILGAGLLLQGLVLGPAPAQTDDAAPADTSAPRPNIVFIMADDLGDEVLGAYGGESFDTPNIDALAESGTRFTHAYSTPVCSPSRATILTGRYTFRYDHSWGHLPASEVTFGNMMRDAGYATAAAGKWQMGLLQEKALQPRRASTGTRSGRGTRGRATTTRSSGRTPGSWTTPSTTATAPTYTPTSLSSTLSAIEAITSGSSRTFP